MPETREQIVERMAQTHFNGLSDDTQRFWDVDDAEGLLAVMSDGLPVAVKAVTDRVRGGLPDAAFKGLVTTDDLLALLDQIDAELGGGQ